jgi:hypothetical protein
MFCEPDRVEILDVRAGRDVVVGEVIRMVPKRGSMTPYSCKAIPMPMVIPPMNWERAVTGLMTRPTENTPSIRGTRISPVSALIRTSANWAPKECLDLSSSITRAREPLSPPPAPGRRRADRGTPPPPRSASGRSDCSDIGRRNLDGVGGIGLEANAGGVVGYAPVRVCRTGDPHAAPPPVLQPGPWRRVAMLPAESFRTKL